MRQGNVTLQIKPGLKILLLLYDVLSVLCFVVLLLLLIISNTLAFDKLHLCYRSMLWYIHVTQQTFLYVSMYAVHSLRLLSHDCIMNTPLLSFK